MIDRFQSTTLTMSLDRTEEAAHCDTKLRPKLAMTKDMLEESWKSIDHFNKSHCGRLFPDKEIDPLSEVTDASVGSESETDDEPDFIIPELPEGETLQFRLLSTWGDPYYVGLNGIEIFTEDGVLAQVSEIKSSLECKVDEVPDCVHAESLIDGNFRTRDDTRLWISPFKRDEPVNLSLKLQKQEKIAMIRIWNYNKSRIHSFRGVKNLEIIADEQIIFKGEISKAEGRCEAAPEFMGDTILFTTRDDILEEICKNDRFFLSGNSIEQQPQSSTGPINNSPEKMQPKRPGTGEMTASKRLLRQDAESKITPPLWHMSSIEGSCLVMKVTKLVLEFHENWGCPDLSGLTGFQLLNRKGEFHPIENAECSYPVNVTRLLKEKNLTTNPNEMWLGSLEPGNPLVFTITFPSPTELIGISVWNYNASTELSYAGMRYLDIYADDSLLLKDVGLRKSPGSLHYDYVQDIFFGPSTSVTPTVKSDNCCLVGFVYQIQLISTWGDDFYIGLNGIQLYGQDKKPILLTLKNLAAFPESVNVIPTVNDDPRSSDKLINGQNDSSNPQNMWLAPLLPNELNRVYLIFDEPMAVSKIVLWNYRKTPSRGTRNFILLVDDLIVFSGEVPACTLDRCANIAVTFST